MSIINKNTVKTVYLRVNAAGIDYDTGVRLLRSRLQRHKKKRIYKWNHNPKSKLSKTYEFNKLTAAFETRNVDKPIAVDYNTLSVLRVTFSSVQVGCFWQEMNYLTPNNRFKLK